MKKVLVLILLVSLLLPLVACSEATTETDESKSNTPEADVEVVAEEEDDLAKLYSDLPKGDYGGFEFAYLNNISNFAYTQMSYDELTGEILNDAFFNRNHKVEDLLNIKYVEEMQDYSNVTSNMKKIITSGDATYSAFWNESKFVAPFATDGSLIDVYGIESINASKPWWYSNVMDEATFGGREFFLVGDVHLMFKESYWMVGFNQNTVTDFNLESPYEIVREGKWTYDKMFDQMAVVASDTNGDGVMDADDFFGATSYEGCFQPLLYASGETIYVKGDDGYMTPAVLGDRFYEVCDKLSSGFFAHVNETVGMSGKTAKMIDHHDMFHNGHSLFYLEPIGSLKKHRDMEAEFGIVPYPKFNEEQADYYTLIAPYAAFCGIPITTGDIERTGVILENLCAYSYQELKDAYYNTTLSFKYIRDAESREMLELIFKTGRMDMGTVLGLTSLLDGAQSAVINGNEVASSMAKSEKVAAKQLEKLLKGLKGE